MPPFFTRWNARYTDARMNRFITAIASRNSADTAVPMSPPTSCHDARFALSAVAVAAIAIDASTTTVEWPSEKKRPVVDRTLAVLHQLSRHVVDRRDVVGVDGVAKAEAVRRAAPCQQQRVVAKRRRAPTPTPRGWRRRARRTARRRAVESAGASSRS